MYFVGEPSTRASYCECGVHFNKLRARASSFEVCIIQRHTLTRERSRRSATRRRSQAPPNRNCVNERIATFVARERRELAVPSPSVAVVVVLQLLQTCAQQTLHFCQPRARATHPNSRRAPPSTTHKNTPRIVCDMLAVLCIRLRFGVVGVGVAASPRSYNQFIWSAPQTDRPTD